MDVVLILRLGDKIRFRKGIEIVLRLKNGICFGRCLFVEVMLRLGDNSRISFCPDTNFGFDHRDIVRDSRWCAWLVRTLNGNNSRFCGGFRLRTYLPDWEWIRLDLCDCTRDYICLPTRSYNRYRDIVRHSRWATWLLTTRNQYNSRVFHGLRDRTHLLHREWIRFDFRDCICYSIGLPARPHNRDWNIVCDRLRLAGILLALQRYFSNLCPCLCNCTHDGNSFGDRTNLRFGDIDFLFDHNRYGNLDWESFSSGDVHLFFDNDRKLFGNGEFLSFRNIFLLLDNDWHGFDFCEHLRFLLNARLDDCSGGDNR